MKKGRVIVVVDTSVFIHDPECIKEIATENKKGATIIVVPRPVISELDGLKSHASKGFKAREASRAINSYIRNGKKGGHSIGTGVPVENTCFLVVDSKRVDFNHPEISLEKNNDSRIILTAMHWKELGEEKGFKVSVITNDGNFKIIAESCGLDAKMYEGVQKIYNELYSGIKDIVLPDGSESLFTKWHKDGGMDISAVPVEVGNLLANQCCVFSSAEKTFLAIYKGEEGFRRVNKPSKKPSLDGAILPKNIEQAFAYALCFDEDIDLVSLAGKAGTGKTLMAILAGYQQMKLGRFDHVLVYRAQVELGEKMGFLPGTLDEKIAPWKYPILDSLLAILGKEGKSEIKNLFEIGSISIEPINYIQGRTLRRSYVLIDEAQNMEPEDMKALITRAGNGTKMVLTGDVAQVRHPYLNSFSNGLTKVVQSLKEGKITGHVTLTKSERSRLAELAADLL